MAQTYKVDSNHTAITSKVMRFGIVNVIGRFNNVSGLITYNPGGPTRTAAEIVIMAASYTTYNLAGEDAVKSQAFLDVVRFPEFKFTLSGLAKLSSGDQAQGSLTIHGVIRSISFPVTIVGPFMDLPTSKQSIGVSGRVTLNRHDFGITMSAKLPNGTPVIGDAVHHHTLFLNFIIT